MGSRFVRPRTREDRRRAKKLRIGLAVNANASGDPDDEDDRPENLQKTVSPEEWEEMEAFGLHPDG